MEVAAVSRPTPTPKAPKVAIHTGVPEDGPAPSSGGKLRIQLGAYSSPAAATTAWGKVSGKLPGFTRITSSAGAMTRLQTGPFASKAAATKGCAAAQSSGLACFAVPAP